MTSAVYHKKRQGANFRHIQLPVIFSFIYKWANRVFRCMLLGEWPGYRFRCHRFSVHTDSKAFCNYICEMRGNNIDELVLKLTKCGLIAE